MSQLRYSNFKKICIITILPQLLLRNLKCPKGKLNKRTYELLNTARKSSDRGPKDDEENEIQMRIIEKCFARRTPEEYQEMQEGIKENHKYKSELKSQVQHSSDFHCEKCNSIISKLFGTDNNEHVMNKNKEILENKFLQDAKLLATTANTEEEKLTQKIETINETPHVEASIPKVEGFNAVQKVQGHEMSTYFDSANKSNKELSKEQADLDELAKRCLDSPTGEIDKILLQELKTISHKKNIKSFDFTQKQDVEKYYSQIFEKFNLDSLNISNIEQGSQKSTYTVKEKCNINRNALQSEHIQPTHLDSIQLSTINEYTTDRKNRGLVKDTGMYYISENENKMNFEVPTLTPYNNQTIPFYEYASKENIISKDYSEIEAVPVTFEQRSHKSTYTVKEKCNINRNALQSEHIQPIHLDSIQLCTINEYTTDRENRGLVKDTGMYYISENENNMNFEVPNLTPYNNQIIPFYEYTNKENIISKDYSEIEAVSVTETVIKNMEDKNDTVTENVPNADSEAVNLEKIATNTESSNELNNSETVQLFAREKENSDQYKVREMVIPRILHPKQIHSIDSEPVMCGHNLLKNIDNNRLFTKSSNDKSAQDIFSDTGPQKHEIQNEVSSEDSATSETATTKKETGTSLELPLNTAISANQNPNEFYNMIGTKELTERIFLYSTPLTHSIETTPKTEELDATIKFDNPYFHRIDPVSQIFFQPYPKVSEIPDEKQTKKVYTEASFEEVSIPKENCSSACSEEGIPLSTLLKMVQERNRLEYCRSIYTKMAATPEEAKKLTCPPPLDRRGPRTTLQPNPCKPKPKEPKPSSTSPAKKDPCAKFTSYILSVIFKPSLSFDTPIDKNYSEKKSGDHRAGISYQVMITEEIIQRFLNICKNLSAIANSTSIETLNKEDPTCARDFQPWVPIPSWPIPTIEKRKPFTCPKEGCKLPVPQSPPPCSKDKPCAGLPKKTFSLATMCFESVYY